MITLDNQQQILQYIKKHILEDKADNIVIEDMNISYKGSTSVWRGSLFKSVDNGTFTLINKNNGWYLNYQIDMRNLFLTTAIMSIVAGVYGQMNGHNWWIGLLAFFWLCGGNWIVNLFRHAGEVSDIAWGIDELICGNTVLPEEDKMTGKLKSWF